MAVRSTLAPKHVYVPLSLVLKSRKRKGEDLLACVSVSHYSLDERVLAALWVNNETRMLYYK